MIGFTIRGSTGDLRTLVLQEMEGTESPILLAQDYHFALLPRMVKGSATGRSRGNFLAHSLAESRGIWNLSMAERINRRLAGGRLDRIPYSARTANNFLETVGPRLGSPHRVGPLCREPARSP